MSSPAIGGVPAPGPSSLITLFTQPSHMGCQLKVEDLAQAIISKLKDDLPLKTAVIAAYRAVNPGTAGSIPKVTLVSFLSNRDNLENVLSRLSEEGVGKVKAVFNQVVFSKANILQITAEADAVIGTLEPDQLLDLQTAIWGAGVAIAPASLPSTLGKALLNPELRTKYETFFTALPKRTKDAIVLLRTQNFLKPKSGGISVHLDTAEKTTPTKHLNPENILRTTRGLPDTNLRALSKAFNRPITRDNAGHTLDEPRRLGQAPAQTAWLIMGSNDLIQVENAYKKWAALPEELRPKVLVFSGYGGHGTVHGPIFAHTEAESMSAYFSHLARSHGEEASLAKCTIIEETNSTNSGQNAQFVKESLDSYNEAHPAGEYLEHFVVFGVPPAISRQVLTVEQNFKQLGYRFATISGYPPDDKTIEASYFLEKNLNFPKELSKPTYHLCALRESATFLDYAISTTFMAPWSPSKDDIKGVAEALNEAAEKYFEGIVGRDKPKIVNPEEFATQLLRVMELKSKATPLSPAEALELTTLSARLSAQIKPFSAYFRQAFANIEESTMSVLSIADDLATQTKLLAESLSKPWDRETLGVSTSEVGRLTDATVDFFLANPALLPAGFPTSPIELKTRLTNPDLWTPNQRPRIEIRKVSGVSSQVAIAFTDGKTRASAIPYFASTFGAEFSISEAGTTTLEIGQIGINKSSPMNMLSYPSLAGKLLDAMDYKEGAAIDARKQGLIVSDADGTIWEAPKAGVEPEALHLGNSAAREGIFNYLLAGGVLVINSGNDVERTIRRVLAGVADLDEASRKTILSRIAVCGMGGHVFRVLSESKGSVNFREYGHYYHLPPCDSAYETSMGYLGDDPKESGNDMPGFAQRRFDKCLCVTAVPAAGGSGGTPGPAVSGGAGSMPSAPSALAPRALGGGLETTRKFFEAVVNLAHEKPGDPLFNDFPTIIGRIAAMA